MLTAVIIGTVLFSALVIGFAYLLGDEKTRESARLKEEASFIYEQLESTLLGSTKEDWVYNKSYQTMSRTISGKTGGKQIEMKFDDDDPRLRVYINEENFLTIRYSPMKNKIAHSLFKINPLDESTIKNKMEAHLNVMKHLRFLHNQFKLEVMEQEKSKKEEEKREKEAFKKQTEKDLKALLKNKHPQQQRLKYGQIEIEINLQGSYCSLDVRLTGILCLEVIYNKASDEWISNRLLVEEEKYRIIHAFEEELKRYAKECSSFYQMKKLIEEKSVTSATKKDNNFDSNLLETEKEEKTSIAKVYGQSNTIQQKMNELSAEKEWLQEESLHLLRETLMLDLQKLLAMYEKVKNKRDIEQDMMDSLQSIKDKLNTLEKEIEQAKVREIRHRKEIIKVR